MVNDALLNAYVFDFLKKRGYLQTAVLFAEECKNLPLAEATADDPAVSLPAALNIKRPESASLAKTESGSEAAHGSPVSTAASAKQSASPQTVYRVPKANVPIDSATGFLAEWWSVFWDVYAANMDKPLSAAAKQNTSVSEHIRSYASFQQKPGTKKQAAAAAAASAAASTTVNSNGKRNTLHETPEPQADAALPAPVPAKLDMLSAASKRAHLSDSGERSPQSAALVAKYSQTDDFEPLHLATQHTTPNQQTARDSNGVTAFPRGIGVNISPSGGHSLSEDYPGYLSRSFKMVAQSQAATEQPAKVDNRNNGVLPDASNKGAAATDRQKSSSAAASPPTQPNTAQPSVQQKPSSTAPPAHPPFASPVAANALVPQMVPTQIPSNQQPHQTMSSPPVMPANTNANANAATAAANAAGNPFQAIHRLMSPPPPPPPRNLGMVSPMISQANAQNDLRRGSTITIPYGMHGGTPAMTPGMTQQQRVGSVGPQQQQQQHQQNQTQHHHPQHPHGPPMLVRQQTMPVGSNAAVMGNPAMMGLNTADLALHGGPNALAAAMQFMAMANMVGMDPSAAAAAAAQQNALIHSSRSSHPPSTPVANGSGNNNFPATIPSQDIGATDPRSRFNAQWQLQQQSQQQQHQQQMGMAMGQHQTNANAAQQKRSDGPAADILKSAAGSNTNLSQGLSINTMSPLQSSLPPTSLSGLSSAPITSQTSAALATGAPAGAGGGGATGATGAAAAAAAAPGFKKIQQAKATKAKRAAKKSSAKSNSATAANAPSGIHAEGVAKSAADRVPSPHQIRQAAAGAGAGAGTGTGTGIGNGGNSSNSSSKTSGSPAMAIKAAVAMGLAKATNVPATQALPFATVSNPSALSSANRGFPMIPGTMDESDMHGSSFAENAFSTLLSQRASQATLHGGGIGGMATAAGVGSAAGNNGTASGTDLASTIASMNVGDLGLQLNEWLSENAAADTLSEILNMGVTMGAAGATGTAGSGAHVGDNGTSVDASQMLTGYNINDPTAAAAAFSSFITGAPGSSANGNAGLSSALSMPMTLNTLMTIPATAPLGGLGASDPSAASNANGGPVFTSAATAANHNV
ncbi:hypothetical protein GGI07_002811 [Coemansia sp. Benny D115]|nr:hypothetical protein GGI07_002811 [Coemansia sp. Benny D115]